MLPLGGAVLEHHAGFIATTLSCAVGASPVHAEPALVHVTGNVVFPCVDGLSLSSARSLAETYDEADIFVTTRSGGSDSPC